MSACLALSGLSLLPARQATSSPPEILQILSLFFSLSLSLYLFIIVSQEPQQWEQEHFWGHGSVTSSSSCYHSSAGTLSPCWPGRLRYERYSHPGSHHKVTATTKDWRQKHWLTLTNNTFVLQSPGVERSPVSTW